MIRTRSVVLIPRSAETVPHAATRVRASRGMRTVLILAPSCFETQRSAMRVWRGLRPRRAAPLHEGEGCAVLFLRIIRAKAGDPYASTAFAHPSRGESADEEQKPDQSGEYRQH